MNQSDFNGFPEEITQTTFEKFAKLLFESSGVIVTIDKRTMVENRLRKRLIAHQINSFEKYYEYTLSKIGLNQGELQKVIDLLTTHTTSFFRENQHFDFIKKTIIPMFKGKKLKAWSAACSSGEEVYTLAMCLTEYMGIGSDWHILGTDISVTEVEKARQGIYLNHHFEGIPHIYSSHMDLFFDKKLSQNVSEEDSYQVNKAIKQKVKFETNNLISNDIPAEKFDLILCRNVLIYFDNPTRKKVVDKLLGALNEGGYLIVSRSEMVSDLVPGATLIEPSIFRKKGRE